jgi:C_GCAxxG_C_C family probable redox protein
MGNAVKFHKEGYNCAESIIKAANEDNNLDIPVALGSAFGAGMSVGGTCGAITGALIAAGGLKGRNNPEEKNNTREITKDVIDSVKEKYGTIQCAELKRKGVSCDEIIDYTYNTFQGKLK